MSFGVLATYLLRRIWSTSISLLQGDAAKWAESNPEAVRLLNTEQPIEATVNQFISLFKQRVPAEVVEKTPVTFDAELADLRQQLSETITAYYTRTLNLIRKYGVKDPSDPSVKRNCAEHVGTTNREVRMLYDIAESTRRAKLEVQKLYEDEARERELHFYKDIAQRNFPITSASV
ncbi:MAG: hypothetical protein ASARMPRED_008164 [Alectoria sarmentosa]|nr:MAG: hypothetical protein ASARMPRED_008164 [Alectoria sarmentosa]